MIFVTLFRESACGGIILFSLCSSKKFSTEFPQNGLLTLSIGV
ncbi:putative lipoprotein [Brucella thiophenivorans]|uniref:Putative lipoprotein n=1 Tax=Brucella thiophenivorans TaxID=571255 RepID=A0A256F328_9HYPH|nr:putative lipoprotein [Brucella thiophenivorans]